MPVYQWSGLPACEVLTADVQMRLFAACGNTGAISVTG
jgi:hypothetical protein